MREKTRRDWEREKIFGYLATASEMKAHQQLFCGEGQEDDLMDKRDK